MSKVNKIVFTYFLWLNLPLSNGVFDLAPELENHEINFVDL